MLLIEYSNQNSSGYFMIIAILHIFKVYKCKNANKHQHVVNVFFFIFKYLCIFMSDVIYTIHLSARQT